MKFSLVLVAPDGQVSKILYRSQNNIMYVTEVAKLRKANRNRGITEPINDRIVTTKTTL